MRILLTLSLLAAAISIGACKDNPATPPTDNSGRPKTGSSFTFDYFDFGSTTPDGTFQFVAGPSGITYYGKSNVVVFDLIPDALILDSMAFAYSSNGDFEAPYVNGYGFNDAEFYASGWSPMGTTNTGTNRQLVTFDTSATVEGVPTTFSFRRTGSYVGTETLQLGGRSLTVHKSVYQQLTTIRGAKTFDAAQVDTVWYAPSIGMMTKWTSYEESEDDGQPSEGGQTWVLKSYVLK